MILIIKDKVYIQSIDIKYILDNYIKNSIPEELNGIKNFDNNKFIELNDLTSKQFVLSDKNIVRFNDFIDMTYSEINSFVKLEKNKLEKYIYNNLYDTIIKPLETSKKIKKETEYINILDLLLLFNEYNNYNIDYIINNLNNYPVELRNVAYKYLNVLNVKDELFNKKNNLNLTKKILTFYYSKKELQQIYYEIISDDLTKQELYPIKDHLQVIFSRINYTPEIQDIIIAINRLYKNNDISFINDDFMESLLKMYGFKTKFEQSVFSLWEDIYVIGYKYLSRESTQMLEVDIERIKNFFKNNLTEQMVKEIKKNNLELSNMIHILMQYNLLNINKIKREIVYNICAYFYLKTENFDYNYDGLYKVINDIYYNLSINFIDKEMFNNNNVYAFSVSMNIFENLYKSYNEKQKIKTIGNISDNN